MQVKLQTREVRDFAKRGDALPVPNLIQVQIESYARFLQKETDPTKRKSEGLENLLREVFPIVSYDGSLKLEYVCYELGEPRYTTDECRALRLTFGMPFRVKVRFTRKDKDEVIEESIYLGEIPIMIGGGEFIINGAERVIVNQLHRSPGATSWSKRRRATGRCTAAGLFPNAVAGSNVRSPRKIRWRSRLTSPPSFPSPRSCGRWTPSMARPKTLSASFTKLSPSRSKTCRRLTMSSAR